MGKRLSLWLSEEEEEKVEKYRKEAEKDRRSLGNYCKNILFPEGDKK